MNNERGVSVHAWPDKRGMILLAFMLAFILLINFSAASVSLGKPAYSIDEKYGLSQGITGWINISVNNENANSLIKDSLNNQIYFLDLIKLNSKANYSCIPGDCENYYSTSNAQTSKKITLEGSEYLCSNGTQIGDVNSDGIINNVDASIVSNINWGIISMPSNICCADIDKNGIIQAADASVIQQITIGMAESPGICLGGKETNTISYGMVFSGEIDSINSISFDVSAKGVPASCISQFQIDIFEDGNIDFQNILASDEICTGSKTYGCYNNSAVSEEYVLETGSTYCQELTLSRAPVFRIGAWVKKESGSQSLRMLLYDDIGSLLENGECNLPDASASGGEVYCDVNVSITQPGAYYACISSDSGTGTYKIKGYDKSVNGCGFFGEPVVEDKLSAYNIFAESKKFSALTEKIISFSNDLDSGDTLNALAENYIIEKNGNLSCSDSCIVPIKIRINSGYEALSLNNIKINYQKKSGIVTSNSLYDLTLTPAIANLKYGKLYLDGSGLKVKNTSGDFTYTLKFNNLKIFSDILTVEKGPEIKGLTPINTIYAFPTNFKINVTSSKNISKYEWNFGDNNTETTTTNRVAHTYEKSGIYTLKVIVRDINNISSSKIFSINVTSPVLVINKTIEKMKADLKIVKSQIDSYDLFYRISLNELIDVNNLSLKVNSIEDKYKKANESDYLTIISELNEMNIPEKITVSESAPNFVFYPIESSINVDVLKEIEEGNYKESEANYIASIYAWNTQNIENNLDYEELSAEYLINSEPLIKVFKFTIIQKEALGYNPYFVIKDMDNLEFKENYGTKSVDGYKYITLTGGTNEIIFSTTEDVNFEDVPAFVSPGLSKLAIVDAESFSSSEEPEFPITTFIIILGIVIIIGVLAYIALHTWYKRKYEGSLFKNRNDLYNILHFIDLQRKRGVSEGEIHEKLKKHGWSSEQIRYATRKHSGKRTGMPGI